MPSGEANKGVKIGTVVENRDVTYNARLKIRVPGYNDNIKVEELPWVSYASSSISSGDGGGSVSIPKIGQKVRVQFKADDPGSMEWTGLNRLDPKLREELSRDYQGAHCLLYDSSSDLSIMYQNATGLRIYYNKSFIQISPDGNITLHSGPETSGVNIQLSAVDNKIDIQAPQQINLTTSGTLKLEANNIILDGKENVQIHGDNKGEIATNAKALYKLLISIARMVDTKIPASGGICANVVQTSQSAIMNQQIQFI